MHFFLLCFCINNTEKEYCETDKKEACLVLKPPKNLSDLFIEFYNFSDQNKNPDNISYCKYYDLCEIKSLNKLNNKSSLLIFHLNKSFFFKKL